MTDLMEVRAVVRREMLDRVVHCLKEAGAPRFTVTRVHALGAGVDPATAGISSDEGTEYADKALLQFICPDERCAMYVELIAREARTGRRGDGIVSVHPVLEVTNVRTGKTGATALS